MSIATLIADIRERVAAVKCGSPCYPLAEGLFLMINDATTGGPVPELTKARVFAAMPRGPAK